MSLKKEDDIDFDKFLLVFAKSREYKYGAQDLRQAFMALDESKTGKIPLKELAFLLSNLGNQKGSTMSQKQFEDLLEKFTPEGGKLDIEKLVDVLHDL